MSAKYPPLVRVTGRPSNIVEETRSFDIDGAQWISFPNQKIAFFWSGTIPEGWKHKPMPNPKNPKFVGVTGILVGLRGVGASKRFHVDISSVTFLSPVPPAHTTKGKYPGLDPCLTNQVDLPLSLDPDSKRKTKGSNEL